MTFTPEQFEKLREELTRPQLTVKMSAAALVRLVDTVGCDCCACEDILNTATELLYSLTDTPNNECLRVFLTRAVTAARARVEADKANTKYVEVFAHRILSS